MLPFFRQDRRRPFRQDRRRLIRQDRRRLFRQDRGRFAEGGFTLIELVVVLAILGILLALAVPRYLSARKRAFEAEIDNILHETKTLSWAYYQENDIFPTDVSNILLQMPAGAVWSTPVAAGGGGVGPITWTSSGVAAPLTATDLCSVILTNAGSSGQGCSF